MKRRAAERGLLFMGADCGTAIIDGVALGFANAVRRGPVGIVGASGTGIQEVSCLLDAAGVGVSHAIGVGGRDLSAEVGGLMMRARPRAAGRRRGHARDRGDLQAARPGRGRRDRGGRGRRPASRWCSASADARGGGARGARSTSAARCRRRTSGSRDRPCRGEVRGLYSGGTLCGEAERIVGHGTFTDFGADEYTEGRAHPMIDPSLRLEHLARRERARAAARRRARLRRPPRSRRASWRR